MHENEFRFVNVKENGNNFLTLLGNELQQNLFLHNFFDEPILVIFNFQKINSIAQRR